MIKEVNITVVFMVTLALLGGTVGCTKNYSTAGVTGTTKTLDNPYNVDYKIVPVNSDSRFGNCLHVTVRGPAAKLAVIFTDPEGKSDIGIISKDHMINNCDTISVFPPHPLDEGPKYQAGAYVLTVKTIDPEKVVWQKEITFSSIMVAQNSSP